MQLHVILHVGCIITVYTVEAQRCPGSNSEGTWHHNGGYCYFISTVQSNFDEAKLACTTLGATLTSVLDQAETDLLLDW